MVELVLEKRLLSDDLLPIINYVNANFLSKAFLKEDYFYTGGRNYNVLLNEQGKDTNIPRSNHGLAHSLRVASYIPLLIGFLKKHGTSAIIAEINALPSESLHLLQMAALFSVVGRKDETGFGARGKDGVLLPGTAKKYREYRERSAQLFQAYLQEQNYFKSDAQQLAFWTILVREMGNVPWIQSNHVLMEQNKAIFALPARSSTIADCLIHLAHCLDLFRCHDLTAKTGNPLSFLDNLMVQTSDSKKDYLRLMQFPVTCMLAMGNYVKTKMDANGVIVWANTKYNIELFALNNANSELAMHSINEAYASFDPFIYDARLNNPKEHPWLVKSIRWDAGCFIDNFILSITKSPQNQHHENLRFGKHKQYTVFSSGVFEYHKRPSPYPQANVKDKKQQRSQHQSTSLITPTAQIPVFGHNRERNTKLVGVILNPEDALINRVLKYDGGTYLRPYEAHDLSTANAYYENKVQSTSAIFFPSLEELAKNLTNDSKNYNEVLARIRWQANSSQIGIFSDSFEARCVAQYYAKKLERRLKKQFMEINEPWDMRYQVPITYYLPGNAKKLVQIH